MRIQSRGVMLQKLLEALTRFIQVYLTRNTQSVPQPVVVLPSKPSAVLPEVIPLPLPPVETKRPLICPIQANDSTGNPVNSRTVKISAVTDHSDTAIDPASSKRWGLHAKDQKVKTFNGEIGDGEASSGPPYGYAKQVPGPFFSQGEINYVGAGSGDKYKATYYLQYDGHAGYDFPYPRLTPVKATADGELHKASDAEDTAYGQGWDKHHTFYIRHSNGTSSWYRHCTKLADDLEAMIGLDFSKSCQVTQGQVVAYVGDFGFPGVVHLHFEVHDEKGKIIDPYEQKLWDN